MKSILKFQKVHPLFHENMKHYFVCIITTQETSQAGMIDVLD